MRTINYGLLCEDQAHEIFVKNLLSQLPASLPAALKKKKVSFHKETTNIKARNKGQVKNKYPLVARYVFDVNNWDLLLIGVDYDDLNQEKFNEEIQKLKEEADKKYHKRTILFMPVQCIEHWLLYLKTLSSTSNKSGIKKLENKSRDIVKKEFYRGKNLASKTAKPIIEKCCEKMDIQGLRKQSDSFNHFYQQLQEFITSL